MSTLSIKHLTLTYKNGVKALNDISLEIDNGMFGLLGPNGAGKSSLMKTIVGLQKPDSGTVFLNGTDVVSTPDFIKKQLGYLPQDFGVYPKVSAWDLLQHLAVLKGVTNAQERKDQVLDLLEKVNLADHKNKVVHTFSGGMRQRFGVAQALLGNPRIIIVDEPTAGLDPEERNRFNALLSEISEDVIVILSTHLVEDVRNLCSHMAIMRKGELAAAGKPVEMTNRLEGKIWTKRIDKNELEKYQSTCSVISRQWVEKSMLISIYADAPPEGFTATVPSLEHVYFHQLNKSYEPG